MEAFPGIEALAKEGNKLSDMDEEIFRLKENGIEKEIKKYKKREEKLLEDKDKLNDRVIQAQKDLKDYCLKELRRTFCYERDGRYFKIMNGAISLTQKKNKSLEEMGYEFRQALLHKNALRKITYDEIIDILTKYHKACEHDNQDRHTIMEVLNYVRENPKMSRLEFADEVKKICDPELRDDLKAYVERATKVAKSEAKFDLECSIDPMEEKIQKWSQNKMKEKQDETMRKKLLPHKDSLDEDLKKRLNIDQKDNKQNQNQKGNHRGGFHQRGNFSQRGQRFQPYGNHRGQRGGFGFRENFRGQFQNQNSRGGYNSGYHQNNYQNNSYYQQNYDGNRGGHRGNFNFRGNFRGNHRFQQQERRPNANQENKN